jgi:hypothetical protein
VLLAEVPANQPTLRTCLRLPQHDWPSFPWCHPNVSRDTSYKSNPQPAPRASLLLSSIHPSSAIWIERFLHRTSFPLHRLSATNYS